VVSFFHQLPFSRYSAPAPASMIQDSYGTAQFQLVCTTQGTQPHCEWWWWWWWWKGVRARNKIITAAWLGEAVCVCCNFSLSTFLGTSQWQPFSLPFGRDFAIRQISSQPAARCRQGLGLEKGGGWWMPYGEARGAEGADIICCAKRDRCFRQLCCHGSRIPNCTVLPNEFLYCRWQL